MKKKFIKAVAGCNTLLVLGMAMLVSSCCCESTIFDDLNKCGKVTLHFRYVRLAHDEYSSQVSLMRHFIFDSHGIFVREERQNMASPQTLRINNLPGGKYTIITVGNATPLATFLNKLTPQHSKLNDFHLALNAQADNTSFDQSEQLFWNYREFTYNPAIEQHYECDLANIHCHLIFEISWQSVPPHAGNYRIELSNLTQGYSLAPNNSLLAIEVNRKLGITHLFPNHAENTITISKNISLFDHRLNGEIISLRYRNNRIPTFRVMYGNEAITKPLDLSKPFKEWGWKPDSRAEQIYRLQIRINDNGSVTVRPWAEGSIEDWQPGGVVMS